MLYVSMFYKITIKRVRNREAEKGDEERHTGGRESMDGGRGEWAAVSRAVRCCQDDEWGASVGSDGSR